ncbi:MAG: GNAT family N-acetyltransferase [Gammaproteobacteria bacterium]|nr:GNAT family N-acetyltransferase [Gammaproteobacteria bacterium]
MNIRFAQESDVPQILRFIQHLADYEKLSHEVVATEQTLKDTLFGEKAYAEVLIAETDDNQASGFALFFYNYSTFLAKPGIHLEDLYVLPEFRDHGIGKALLKKLAAITLERDCGRLEWNVLDWNTPAIDFYKSQGAIMMEGWTTNRVAGDALPKLAED